MTALFDMMTMVYMFAAMGAAYFIYMVVTKGLPYAWSKVVALWGTVKDDAAAASKFLNVQNDIAIVKADIAAIKAKIGL